MSRSTSPLPRSVDIALEQTNLEGISNIELEEENIALKKQVRQLDTDNKMIKAVLEQKIELLESQIEEFRGREANLKKMNESIMFALNDVNNRDQNALVGKATKELELATEHHKKEIQEIKNRTSELIKNLETENKTLKEASAETELRLKELKIHFEKAQLGFQQTISELEQGKITLEAKIKTMQEESLEAKELSEHETLVQVNELKNSNERIKEEFKKEIQKVKEEYEKSIQELKAAHEDEKKALETKIEKSQEVFVQEIAQRETSTAELHSKFHQEVQTLKDRNEQMKLEHQKEVNDLKRHKDEAQEKAEKFDSQVKKLKVTLKNSQHIQEQNSKLLKEKLEKAKEVMEHGENLISENKKYKQKITELRSQVKNLEASEQKLKGIIQGNYENIDEETKRKLNFDQSLFSQSVQDSALSQTIAQPKSARDDSGSKLSGAPTSTHKKNNPLASSVPPSLKPAQLSLYYPQQSPLQEKSLTDTIPSRLNSQRYEREESPYVTITPAKYSKALTPESLKQKPENVPQVPEIIEKKKERPSSESQFDYGFGPGTDTERIDKDAPNTATTVQRAALLETSFADQGFSIESDMDELKTEKYRGDNEELKNRVDRNIDIDTIPMNYSEFVDKRSQREKPQRIDPEKILGNEFESNMESSAEDTEHRIFFRTSQDDNQPLFGTSHFMMEGIHDEQEQGEGTEDIDTERMSFYNESNKPANKQEEGKNNESKQEEETDREYKAPEKGKILATEEDWDLDDITNIREKSEKERLSVNLKRRDSSAKSFTREDLENRPSLMNPLHTVFDSGSIDTFQEPAGSLDLSTGNSRSVIDRNRSIEREKEKAFSSRHSFSGSVSVGPGSKGNQSGSRQKIEGRLKDLEWKLKDMELKNKGLRIEKDKVQLEYEKLMLDLKEKKTESENMKNSMNVTRDEIKEEKEAALKNEIKFLIGKLLKVKNKLEKQSEELNTTKTSNILNQSQVNYSVLSAYHLPGKKDYSREYGTLGSSQNLSHNLSLTTQIKERENLTQSSAQNSSRRKNCQPRGTWTTDSSAHLNTSAAKPENYRMSERGHTRSTLGVIIDNASKNTRSKSNARYEGEEDLRYTSIGNGNKPNDTNVPVVMSSRSNKLKMPNLPKGEDMNMSGSGPWLGREALKQNINVTNYESINKKNIENVNHSNFLYHRKSTR